MWVYALVRGMFWRAREEQVGVGQGGMVHNVQRWRGLASALVPGGRV